jgi:hypothetical protein
MYLMGWASCKRRNLKGLQLLQVSCWQLHKASNLELKLVVLFLQFAYLVAQILHMVSNGTCKWEALKAKGKLLSELEEFGWGIKAMGLINGDILFQIGDHGNKEASHYGLHEL